ncbi:iron complex transport system substrate-binding protein [Sanguibacter gelidistatuariae]|uniref:Iron complex transport system substrate-binding protein n=1 Tax=Sanguibacter gelidistatuariae TaxID=1814289 RepID=A0A1G6UXV0_9MICO|nr:iron-siderophore ABC transporter substrate-binding protein [Sanguibacter gelidistatuariae]SDD46118.1 iron complex transport system substrate-binding protein [Sanguibacter gelidistatuariae]
MSASSLPIARARRALVAATTAALVLALAACGSSDDTDGDATPSGSAASDSTDAFPVTITGALGETVIEKAPERVVTLGWGADDIAVSLGVIPVGTEGDTWAGDADGYHPWFREAVEAEGAALPETITMYPELDVEAIIALEPDLILAPQSGINQATFDQLSEFTNVVAYPDGPWITPIDEQITIAATALGKSDKAQGLIDGIDTTLSAAAADHPEFEGKTIAYVAAQELGTLDVYVPGDPRIDTLLGLGFTLAPSVADLTAPAGQFVAPFGLENADKLSDVDVLFTWFNDTDEQAATEAQPLFAAIPAFASGAYVPMVDRQLGMAVTVGTPLSVPWAIDRYVPMIAEAVAKVG